MNNSTSYLPFPTCVFRTPHTSFQEFAKTFARLEADENYWNNFLKDKVLQEAIFLGSPVLYDEIQKFLTETLTASKEVYKLKMAVLRYYTRMSTRCTPFGLFAGFSMGKIGENSEIELADSDKYSRYTRLDMNYLCNLVQDICKLPEVRKYLKYYPNSSLYPLGEKLRYVEYYYKKARRIHNINAVDNSEYIGVVLEKARGGAIEEIAGQARNDGMGAKIEELAALLVNDDITLEEATAFIHELIDNQLLVSELEPAVTGKDFLIQFLNILQSIENLTLNNVNVSEKLTKIATLLSEIDVSETGNTMAQYADIEDIVKKLGTAYEAKFLFQTDMFKPVNKAVLDEKIIQNIQEALELMNKISLPPSETLLSKFAENYYERYEDSEMPLLQVLDTENGIGYRQNSGDISPLLEGYLLPERKNTDIKWNRIQSVLLKKYLDAVKNHAYSAEIKDKDFDFLTANWDDFPPTFSGMCEMFSNKNGEPLIYVHSSGGSSAANLLGRFCHVNQELESYVKEITDFEQAQNTDVIYAEIVHLPESRTGNILLRPVLRSYEIPYLGKPSVAEEFQISLSDLYVSVKGKNVFLHSKRLNKRIIPRLSTAHNFSFNSMPVYHFLCDMQTQGLRAGVGFSWGSLTNEYEFLPRVLYKNVILSLAKWTIKTENFLKVLELEDKNSQKPKKSHDVIADNDPQSSENNVSNKGMLNQVQHDGVSETAMQNLKKWREERQLPQYVVLPDGDNELFVDMESRLSVQTLISVTKKRKSFQLEEFPFDANNALVKDEAGNAFTNEFVFGFYKSQHNE